MIIREIAFCYVLFVHSLKTSRKRTLAILKNKVSIKITSHEVIIARYDTILDQSERAHLYNHLSNYARNKELAIFVDHSGIKGSQKFQLTASNHHQGLTVFQPFS